jgi:hypothetical protein
MAKSVCKILGIGIIYELVIVSPIGEHMKELEILRGQLNIMLGGPLMKSLQVIGSNVSNSGKSNNK